MDNQFQMILGQDSCRPEISIVKKEGTPEMFEIYSGFALIETVSTDKQSFELKLCSGRLYNTGLKPKTLVETFGIAYTTIRRWADALISVDKEKLLRLLEGPGATKKIDEIIERYIAFRFHGVYQKTHYNYSSIIRKEIKEIFEIEISAESLRPIFKRLKNKKELIDAQNIDDEKLANTCDLNYSASIANNAVFGGINDNNNVNSKGLDNQPNVKDEYKKGQIDETHNRKYSITFFNNSLPIFYHHLGVLIFSDILSKFDERFKNAGLIKQFFISVLLGAKNIEQTKFLNFNALKIILGDVTRNLFEQRTGLADMAMELPNRIELLKLNAELVQLDQYSDFYFDPHIKRYTGIKNIIKCWCSNIRLADKAINMDFVHIALDGYPVYIENTDNFYDIRERFFEIVKNMRDIFSISEKEITFVIDRGIYSFEVFSKIIDDPKLHIITWEKGYRRTKWESEKITGSFSYNRERNNSQDKVEYKFEYIEQDWGKNTQIKQIIVQATNPNNNTIQVSILSDNKARSAKEVILLMLSRWIQENDFKYEDIHFGINAITSYKSIPYQRLKGLVTDKNCKLGEYKAIEMTEKEIKNDLKNLLLKQQMLKDMKKKKDLQEEVIKLTNSLKELQEQKERAQKEGSKLEELISHEYFLLNTENKEFMDCIKILARNVFYKALEPFKEGYDNYRDDHAIFRNLTHSHGFINTDYDYKEVEVTFRTQ